MRLLPVSERLTRRLRQLRRWTGRCVIFTLLLQAVFYLLPVPTALGEPQRLVKCNVGTYFVVTADHALVGWGRPDNGLLPACFLDFLPLLYPFRQTILRDVSQIDVGYGSMAAVDRQGWLWGWGEHTLAPEEIRNQHWPVRLMDDVAEAALGNGRAAVIRKDGSLWGWGCSYGFDGDQTYYTPYQIADEAAFFTFSSGRLFFTDRDGTLYEDLGNPNQPAAALLTNIQEIQYFGLNGRDYKILTADGEVFFADSRLADDGHIMLEVSADPLMDHVAQLTSQGWITEDGTCWTVTEQGELKQGPAEIAALSQSDFYVTQDGRLHHRFLPPVSTLAVSTVLRDFIWILCILWLLLGTAARRTALPVQKQV